MVTEYEKEYAQNHSPHTVVTDFRLNPAQRLHMAAVMFEQRNAEYGGNYKQFGELMEAIFPSEYGHQQLDDKYFGRLNMVMMMAAKLQRYCFQWAAGKRPSPDHLTDIAVYAMMLQELDEEQQ